ncbi:peptidoglycan recognition protein family protein [Capillimicrobium parvum]|uniref:Peptidoglycan recognition protein family domain-containing protein n=1 Tax=Capillimicrobium parvum TaxID=2884022 RepID=A0A9E7C2D2_9ACTN|nr:peptidoglycan recognition protein [Capillimicrobium parvum]UGS38445.1 hypothetical protein DSM104329_04873 [Capillimicrobium parvum]
MTSAPHDLSRRRLLGLGLMTAGAVWLETVPGASEALARARRGPTATSAAIGLPRARRIGPVDVPGGLDLAGLRWSGRAHPRIELRARRPGGRFTEWLPVAHAHDHGPDGSGPASATDPVWTGRSDAVELRLDHPVDGLTLHTVRTDRPRGVFAHAAQAAPVTDGGPAVITRAQWGADSLRLRGRPEYGSVQLAFVHHTVNANDYLPEDAAGIVLAIAKYHISGNGWNDIGYNFLVDKYGQIFEGRAGGMTEAVIGAQAQGYNSVSTGISNIGTFETVAQTDPALNAMAQLIGWKLALHGAPVEGEIAVVSAGGASNRYPSGRTVTLQRISGHRDGDKTSCPGSALYAQLPEIRRRAAARDYPVAVTPETTSQITINAASTQVAANSSVLVSGSLVDVDGGPMANAEVRVQKLGATRWSTAAHAVTDKDGLFHTNVLVRQNSRLRAYWNGDADLGGEPLTSPTVNVSAVPSMTARLSAKRVGVGGTVTVSAALRPTRKKVQLTISKKGRDGRYSTVRRVTMTVSGSTARATVRLTQPGLYGFSVAALADSRAMAVTTPLIHVRCARGATAGQPVEIDAGGTAQTEQNGSGGVAASAR